jgi:hypothetical protein
MEFKFLIIIIIIIIKMILSLGSEPIEFGGKNSVRQINMLLGHYKR